MERFLTGTASIGCAGKHRELHGGIADFPEAEKAAIPAEADADRMRNRFRRRLKTRSPAETPSGSNAAFWQKAPMALPPPLPTRFWRTRKCS
jgi:hypothetical protein